MDIRVKVTFQTGETTHIEGSKREDWGGLMDPCPVCGDHEFDHFRVSGGHYGKEGNDIVERTDYWSAKQVLFTQCKSCDEVLFKHPAFDLLFDPENDNEAVIEMR